MRSKQEITGIWVNLFPRFAGSSGTLQGRVKEMMVHSILMGLIPVDAKIPPSRTLAEALSVSRNTVSLALQALVDKGFLVSKERSGLFVNRNILLGQAVKPVTFDQVSTDLDWTSRLISRIGQQRNIVKPVNWHDYRFPFVYGQFDQSLMPLRDWRDCVSQSMLLPAVKKWSQGFVDRDYDALIDQIQNRLLPARGVIARREEILVTAGAQMACYLLANVLFERKTIIGVENPGYPDARNIFSLRSEYVRALPIDEEGLIASTSMGRCDYVFTTPSHQCPTTVTMSLHRRNQILEQARKRDIVLIEDDQESELNFSGKPLPALKSLDTDGRVIYLGSLSKTLSHGLRIGFMVGPAALIRELRALRRLIMRHPPTNNAHTASLFIAQGHHDAFIRKLNVTYRERREVLVNAFATYLPQFQITPSLGGSGAWIKGPDGLNCQELQRRCASHGVLLEAGDVFFENPSASTQSFFRMGYSAIASNLVRPGIEVLRDVFREMP
jgi:GntR family transcriptional regulator/MocR family aminotransferase